MDPRPLTSRQQAVLSFVARYAQIQGYPPTLREIGDGVGLANLNAVRGHLAALEKKGHLTRVPDKARSIQLVQAPPAGQRTRRVVYERLTRDSGVQHKIVYGLAWCTWQCQPRLTGPRALRLRRQLDREALDQAWTLLDVQVEADHVVVILETWPHHAPHRTVQHLKAACGAGTADATHSAGGTAAWAPGYVASTDLEVLDELIARFRQELERGGPV